MAKIFDNIDVKFTEALQGIIKCTKPTRIRCVGYILPKNFLIPIL